MQRLEYNASGRQNIRIVEQPFLSLHVMFKRSDLTTQYHNTDETGCLFTICNRRGIKVPFEKNILHTLSEIMHNKNNSHQFKVEERRRKVASLLSQSMSETEIAEKLNVNQSTISRDEFKNWKRKGMKKA